MQFVTFIIVHLRVPPYFRLFNDIIQNYLPILAATPGTKLLLLQNHSLFFSTNIIGYISLHVNKNKPLKNSTMKLFPVLVKDNKIKIILLHNSKDQINFARLEVPKSIQMYQK